MKKLVALILTGAMALSLAACGTKEAEVPKGAEVPKEANVEGEKAPAQAVTIQVGYENNDGEPIDTAVKKWAQLVEEKSSGSLKLELFPSSQLGAKGGLVEQMIMGENVVTIIDGGSLAEYGVPDLGIFTAPYLFDSWESAWKVVDSDWYTGQKEKLSEAGIEVLAGNWIFGERHIMTTSPVRSLADFRNKIMRTPDNISQLKGFEVLGAAPTAMPIGEVYTALNQGTIEGLENTLPVLYGGSYAEVCKYITLTGHVRMIACWIAGTEFFNTLSPEHQEILTSCAEEAGLYNNELQEKAVEDALKGFAEHGTEIIQLEDAKLEEFKEQAKAFYELPEIKNSWTEGLYDTIQAIMK